MYYHQGEVYHVYNRGNNKQRIFFNESNYLFFLEKIKKHLMPNCSLLAWCLMPNHFHLLIVINESGCVERESFGGKPMQEICYQIGNILSSYSQAINKERKRTGSLFQQKTKSKLVSVSPGYLIACLHYIHQNPLKAGLVEQIEAWRFSSFRGYAGIKPDLTVDWECLERWTGLNKKVFYKESYAAIDPGLLEYIW